MTCLPVFTQGLAHLRLSNKEGLLCPPTIVSTEIDIQLMSLPTSRPTNLAFIRDVAALLVKNDMPVRVVGLHFMSC